MAALHASRSKTLLWVTIVLMASWITVSLTPVHSAPPHSWSAPAAANPAPGGGFNEGAAGAFVAGKFYYLEHGGGLWHFDPTVVASTWVADPAPPFTHFHGMATMAHAPGPGGCGTPADEIFVVVSPAGVGRFHPTCGWYPTSAPPPTGFTDWSSVVTLGSRVYVFDGFGGNTNSYDPVANTWNAAGFHPAPPLANMAVTAAVAHGGVAYLFGGENAGPSDDVQIFSPTIGAGGTWIATYTTPATGAMPTARGWAVAGVCANEIYVMGGDSSGGGVGNLATVEIFDTTAPPASAWSTGPVMINPQAEMAAGLVSNSAGTMVAMTGWSTAFPGNSDQVQVLSATCTGNPPPPKARINCRATAIEVTETDQTGAIGNAYSNHAQSTADAKVQPVPASIPATPLDPPANPQATGTAQDAGFSYTHPSGVSVQMKNVFSECKAYAAYTGALVSGHVYGRAGIEDLTISTSLLSFGFHVEAADFEMNTWGSSSSGIQANYACDQVEVDLTGLAKPVAICTHTSNTFTVGLTGTTVTISTPEVSNTGAIYDGVLLRIVIDDPTTTRAEIEIGHVEIDEASISAAATPATYIPNTGCLVLCT